MPTPCACLTVQHLQWVEPACCRSPSPPASSHAAPLQGVGMFSTVTSWGFRATGLHYVTQASLRGFQDWSPQELTKRFTGTGVGRVRLVGSGSRVTWTDVAFLPWPLSVSGVHRETPRTGNALGAVAAALWHCASPGMGTIQCCLESVSVGGVQGREVAI